MTKKLSNLSITFLLHIGFYLLALGIAAQTGILKNMPSSANVARFDCVFYHSIAYENYFAKYEDGGGNTGFFPLFPFFWHLLQTDYLGISIFNLLISLASIYWLAFELKLKRHEILLYLSMPSFIFFYLPLSEAVFFLFSTCIIIGLYKENKYLTFFGFLMASMARPSSIIFIPALFLMEVLTLDKKNIWQQAKDAFINTFASFLGLATIVIYQWQKTGIWFAYFNTQSKYASRVFSIPSPNFAIWNIKNLSNDGFALWTGLVAATVILLGLLAKIWKKEQIKTLYIDKIPKYVLFSILFVAGIAMLNVLANPKTTDGRTALMAENRYVISNPFFFIALIYALANLGNYSKNILKILSVSAFLIFLSLCEYNGFPELKEQYLIKSDVLTVFLGFCFLAYLHSFLFMAWKKEWQREIFMGLYIIQVMLQIFHFNQFMLGEWVG